MSPRGRTRRFWGAEAEVPRKEFPAHSVQPVIQQMSEQMGMTGLAPLSGGASPSHNAASQNAHPMLDAHGSVRDSVLVPRKHHSNGGGTMPPERASTLTFCRCFKLLVMRQQQSPARTGSTETKTKTGAQRSGLKGRKDTELLGVFPAMCYN